MLHIPVSCRHLTPMSADGGAACDGGCQARAQRRSSRASGRKMEVLHRPAGPGEQVRPLGYGTAQPGTRPLLPPGDTGQLRCLSPPAPRLEPPHAGEGRRRWWPPCRRQPQLSEKIRLRLPPYHEASRATGPCCPMYVSRSCLSNSDILVPLEMSLRSLHQQRG